MLADCSSVGSTCQQLVDDADDSAVGAGAVAEEAALVFLEGECVGDFAGQIVADVQHGVLVQLIAVLGQHHELFGGEPDAVPRACRKAWRRWIRRRSKR